MMIANIVSSTADVDSSHRGSHFYFPKLSSPTVLQPVSNQYNISDKIKEANQQLYVSESTVQRQSQPKVRFRDHKLVDYEPEDVHEIMEKNTNAKVINNREDDSSDDGYIDDEVDATTSIEETVEIEDVCEQIEQDEEKENNEKESPNNENYSKEDFHEESEGEQVPLNVGNENPVLSSSNEACSKPEKPTKPPIFRPKSSKVNPSGSPSDQPKLRKTCCDFKETDEYKQTLPKYNGFNSNYGLSKEEIAKREFVQLKQRQHKELKTIHQMEQQEFVASLNEEAFSKWYSYELAV